MCWLGSLPALAGDRALADFIGYSPDGQYFAFEEYGVQDGSGFAYASIYVVDLAADKWVAGSPFKAMADDEGSATLADIRAEAAADAADVLAQYDVQVPAEILFLNGDGMGEDQSTEVHWSTPACCGPGQIADDEMGLKLSLTPALSKEDYCAEMNPVGFRLTYEGGDGPVVLHEDGETLPKSRGCTLDYRLYAVTAPFQGGSGHQVAIIASYPFGFEGPDRRFLAVPIAP